MIEIRSLYKYYGSARVLGPVDGAIAEGEVVGLLGLNGAGKTTTLRILACDLLPTSGTVRVGGFDVVEQPEEVRARIGYLPDKPPLYDEMTPGELLTFAARLRGVSRDKLSNRVADAIEQTELGEVRNQLIGTLSHGFRQRVGIAQAIVHDPALVVLDEPISGLDPAQIVEMRRLVRSLKGDHTVLVSSHILGEISETCDRLFVIREGRIVASGSEESLVAQHQGVRIDVTLRRGDETAVRSVAERVQPGAEVEPIQKLDPSSDSVTFRIQLESDMRAEICRALVEAGLDILEFGRSERNLESTFLELSSGETEEEVGA